MSACYLIFRNPMKKVIYILGFVAFFVTDFSCTFHNEQEYFGDLLKDTSLNNCNTIGITYDSLSYIFEGNCKDCHKVGDTYRGGIEFDDYNQTVNSFKNNEDKILTAIKHEGPYKMPFRKPKLSECEIAKIEEWINNEMPE